MEYIIMALLAVIIIIIVAFALIVKPKKLTEEQKKRLCGHFYAHRGLYKQDQSTPENSMPAFRLAARRGYGIELDVRMTKDGRLAVFHDEGLKRACGAEKTRVRKLDYEELSQYRLFGTDEHIPLLGQVLEEVAGRVPLLIDVKTVGAGQTESLCERLWERLRDYKGGYAVLSADPEVLVWFRRNAPDVLRGQVTDGYREKSKRLSNAQRFSRRNLLSNLRTRPHIIACSIGECDALGVRLCLGLFKPLSVAWTVREELDSARLRNDFNILVFEFYAPN